jgi:ABC-2 type transport system ATP-binding protein
MAAVETDSLSMRFGGVTALACFSVRIPEGACWGLLGPNGAGKSTLIRILATLLAPSSGVARVDGHDVMREPDRVRRVIGYVPQPATSDPELTAAENLEFYAGLHNLSPRAAQPRIEEALVRMGLIEWSDRLVRTFSGGMRRRLEVARGLIHQPRVLLLDEPTGGLDAASRLALWELLKTLQREQGLTILLATHQFEEAGQLCDHVVILDRGRLAAAGAPAPLLEELYARQREQVAAADVRPARS